MSHPTAATGHTLRDWRPEEADFWQSQGRKIAGRNLWISIPALLLAFSVWMVWSVVVAKMPAIGGEGERQFEAGLEVTRVVCRRTRERRALAFD